jgi:hypothetical protein
VVVHLGLQVGHTANHLRQRAFVAFGQLLHSLGELSTYAVHFAVDDGIERGEPFVVHYERLDIGLSKLAVMGVGLGVERRLGVLNLLLDIGLVGVEPQPIVQHRGFVLRFLVALDLLQPCRDVSLVDLVEFGERSFLAAMFLLQFGEFSGDPVQLCGELVNRCLFLGVVAGDND